MGLMTSPASDSLREIVRRLDQRVRKVDEERWLSSRYAPGKQRDALIVLYAFYYELARVRLAVSEATLGQIRFQWWREALEEIRNGSVREHDVVIALGAQIEAGAYKPAALQELVTRHEAAFLKHDRRMEPEGYLAALAAKTLVSAHSYGEAIRSIAPAWAALRRGEKVPIGTVVTKLPGPLRPALAHFRLRRAWGEGRQPGRLGRRASILAAMLTGSI